MKKLDKSFLEELLRHLLHDEYLSFLVVDVYQIKQIQVFVKTTNEFIWGDRFIDDPVYEYLERLGYTDIRLTASKEIKGGVWDE